MPQRVLAIVFRGDELYVCNLKWPGIIIVRPDSRVLFSVLQVQNFEPPYYRPTANTLKLQEQNQHEDNWSRNHFETNSSELETHDLGLKDNNTDSYPWQKSV